MNVIGAEDGDVLAGVESPPPIAERRLERAAERHGESFGLGLEPAQAQLARVVRKRG
jgi:hypothetical protein